MSKPSNTQPSNEPVPLEIPQTNYNSIPQQQQQTNFDFMPQQNYMNMNSNSQSFIPQQNYMTSNAYTYEASFSNASPYGGLGDISVSSNRLERITVSAKDMESVERKTDEVVAVIVTICEGSSYDNLFASVPQLSPEGIVAVYRMRQKFTQTLLERIENDTKLTLENETESEALEELFANIASVEPNSVVFNWECCSGCSDGGYSDPNSVILMSRLLERGFMVMCSDFAVKALVSKWDAELLGPNPFIRAGEFSSNFEIRFSAQTLLDCPSTQLQKLGELCEDGKAVLHAMGGTIAFLADMEVASKAKEYEFSLLTIGVSFGGQSPSTYTPKPLNRIPEIDCEGLVGHASLAYPSGGILMVSCGHWIELTKVNTSEEAVLRAAEKMYGQAYTDSWQQNLSKASSQSEKSALLNNYSAQMIQNCSPAVWSKKC